MEDNKMFNSKKTNLFESRTKKETSAKNYSTMVTDNQFLMSAMKQSAKTTSLGNHALKYTTTGSNFVDQFGKITNYRSLRSYDEVSLDMSTLWAQDKTLSMKLLFYIRMITRSVTLPDGTKTKNSQRGQGLKHEAILRMIWVHMNDPEVFWKNIPLFVSIGSWKDIVTMLSYDLQYNGWENRQLNWNNFGQLILAGLENPVTSDLVKKYLPQIKSKSNCTTIESQADNIIAKWICSLVFGKNDVNGNSYMKYRKLKTSGKAHEWQKLISKGKFLDINFNTVHGRALSQLVSSKFLSNHGLVDKYTSWIESQPVAKYTGYVYELFAPVKKGYNNQRLLMHQETTINKQFYQMIETAKKGMKSGKNGLITVVDSSSSMTSSIPGSNVSSYDVAKSMALYFSYLLDGPFHKAWLEFNDESRINFWKGETPVQNLQNDRSEAYGSTDFQSIGGLFGQMLVQGVSEEEFPTGIVCVSDGCFNSTGRNMTNFKALKLQLSNYGFSKEYVENFKVVLWDIPNGYYRKSSQTSFEDFADCPNLYHISGLDGSAIAFLTGVEGQKHQPKTSEELFLSAMDQEVLNLIVV